MILKWEYVNRLVIGSLTWTIASDIEDVQNWDINYSVAPYLVGMRLQRCGQHEIDPLLLI
jgi:hypothetical protein